MDVLKEKLSKVKGKIHLVVWGIFWAVTAFIFFSNSSTVIGDKANRPFWVWILYFGIIALLIFSVVFCTRRWLFCEPKRDEKGKIINGRFRPYHFIFFALISAACFLIMELVNNSEKLLQMLSLIHI